VKIADSRAPLPPNVMDFLGHEADKMRRLNHPNIVRLLEFVSPRQVEGPERDGFIVLEYIDGTTLQELFEREPLSPIRLAQILTTVADALNYAHHSGLIHRDLKPANILLDRKQEPHICDFGLAIDVETQLLLRPEIAGTLSYMAPEQVWGQTPR